MSDLDGSTVSAGLVIKALSDNTDGAALVFEASGRDSLPEGLALADESVHALDELLVRLAHLGEDFLGNS